MNDKIRQKIIFLNCLIFVSMTINGLVVFNFGSAVISFGSYGYLDELGDLLVNNPEWRIKLSGHTDNVGDETGNQRLSESRAKAVRTYLLKNGIDAKRVKAVGHGESQPIASNSTEEGKQKNRRTEVRILSK